MNNVEELELLLEECRRYMGQTLPNDEKEALPNSSLLDKRAKLIVKISDALKNSKLDLQKAI